MRKLAMSLVAVFSFALADELPVGSKQHQAFDVLVHEIGVSMPCPPELRFEGIESGCALYPGKAKDFARAVQDALETQSLPLDAVERVWSYDDAFQRY